MPLELSGSILISGSSTLLGNQTIAGSLLFDANGFITLDNSSVIKDNANQSIAFGVDAASSGQGVQSTAIGSNAGQTDQGNGATALGALAGNLEQGQSAVAVGALAGSTQQGQWSIAVGTQAGGIGQGDYSIAIGNLAGALNQASHSIVISALGSTLDNTTANSLKIAPIRNTNGNDGVLQYNTTTNEVSYATTLNGITNLATTGSNTFTGVQTVESDLVVSGSLIAVDNFVLPTTASVNLMTGSFYFDFINNKLFAYNGTTWVTASLGA